MVHDSKIQFILVEWTLEESKISVYGTIISLFFCLQYLNLFGMLIDGLRAGLARPALRSLYIIG